MSRCMMLPRTKPTLRSRSSGAGCRPGGRARRRKVGRVGAQRRQQAVGLALADIIPGSGAAVAQLVGVVLRPDIEHMAAGCRQRRDRAPRGHRPRGQDARAGGPPSPPRMPVADNPPTGRSVHPGVGLRRGVDGAPAPFDYRRCQSGMASTAQRIVMPMPLPVRRAATFVAGLPARRRQQIEQGGLHMGVGDDHRRADLFAAGQLHSATCPSCTSTRCTGASPRKAPPGSSRQATNASASRPSRPTGLVRRSL